MPEMTPGAAQPMPAPPVNNPPGPTGQATVPPDQAGRRMQAYVQIAAGLNVLERALGLLGGSQTEDGRELMSLLVKARKRFGGAAPDLQRQELKALGEGVQPVQQPTPMQGQALQSAIQAKQRSQGLPAPAAA